MNAMPLAYTASGNAWMTAIFKEWFHKTFVPAVRRHLGKRRLEEKAVQLLDNCRVHPPANLLRSADGNITVIFPAAKHDQHHPAIGSGNHILVQALLSSRISEADGAN